MKSFKNLTKELFENHGAQTSFSVAGTDIPKASDAGGQHNMFAIENPRILDRLNAAISHITRRPVVDPSAVVCEIKDKILPFAGLSCHLYGDIEEGEYRFNLKQFNGRMGATPEEGVLDLNDDGITYKLGHGLDLRIMVVKNEDYLYSVNAAVIPALSEDMIGDDEAE